LLDHEALTMALKLTNGDIKKARQLAVAMQKLYAAFMHADASLAEINPYVFTPAGEGYAIDAKMNLDDNAQFRHPDYEQLRDLDEEDAAERQAREAGLSFVKLEGNVGCLVNGAGLAMATMDIIKHHGGSPANFLDVGGSASKEAVTEAFKLILTDERVEGIMVNIFGGIMKCDTIASGIVAAVKEAKITVPLVVRLEGTNVDIGRKILNESWLTITTAETMADAAQKIVELASSGERE